MAGRLMHAANATVPAAYLSRVPYQIRDLRLSPDKIEWLWRRLERRPSEFSDFEAPNAAAFQAAMFDRDVLWFEFVDPDQPEGPEESHGLIALAVQEHDPNALVSVTMFDKRPGDKIAALRTWVRGLFTRFPIHRVSTEVPRVHFALKRLVEHTGFTYEGKRRDGARLKGQWVTVNLYGLLRSEVDAWP